MGVFMLVCFGIGTCAVRMRNFCRLAPKFKGNECMTGISFIFIRRSFRYRARRACLMIFLNVKVILSGFADVLKYVPSLAASIFSDTWDGILIYSSPSYGVHAHSRSRTAPCGSLCSGPIQ